MPQDPQQAIVEGAPVGAPIRHETAVAAAPDAVWAALTDPARMPEWMADASMGLSVETDWTVGGPIRMTGRLHGSFTNTGTVLVFDPPRSLRYTHLSSVSRLADLPEHHAVIDIAVDGRGDATVVTVTVTNSHTAAIRHHLDFYWGVALESLRRYVEPGGG